MFDASVEFTLQKITVPSVIVLGGAWVATAHTVGDGVAFALAVLFGYWLFPFLLNLMNRVYRRD